MYITVVGGGNSSPIFAALCKDAGHTVAVYTRRPDDWDVNDVGFVNDDLTWFNQRELRVKIDLVTNDPAKCIPQSDMIFIAGLPIHHNPTVLAQIKPHMDMTKKVFVGTICGYGGFNWVAAKALGPGNYAIFGSQLIPWCCGTVKYGHTGLVIGAKRFVRIATEDGKDSAGVVPHMEKILKLPGACPHTDFLASTFWPNNPSLHPPILYGVFKDWDGKTPFDPETLPKKIYSDLRTGSAFALEQCNAEILKIVEGLRAVFPNNAHLQGNFDLGHCIIENYKEQVLCQHGIVTAVLTNKAFGKHYIPYTTVEGGVVPTLAHKFFETDLPFGLCTFKDVALMLGVETPLIDAMIIWNQKLINKEYLSASGKIDGTHASECILPSAMGLELKTLEYGNRGK